MLCDEGYYPDNKECHPCSKMLGCKVCNNNMLDGVYKKECYECDTGYRLNGTTCNQIKFCKEYEGNSCKLCTDNFVLNSDGLCDSYTTIEGCSSSSNNICQSCTSQYYYDESNTCQRCMVEFCATCSTTGECIKCKEPYTLRDGRCVECSTEIPFCITCNTESFSCLNCVGGNYVNEKNGSCVSCVSTFPDCQDCNGEHCTMCQGYHYLDPDDEFKCHVCSEIDGCAECSQYSKLCLRCISGTYYRASDDTCKRLQLFR